MGLGAWRRLRTGWMWGGQFGMAFWGIEVWDWEGGFYKECHLGLWRGVIKFLLMVEDMVSLHAGNDVG